MTVKGDLQKAVAAAESCQGTYATFTQATDDPSAKQMFKQMEQDMDRHISALQSRLSSTASSTTTSSASESSNSYQ
jgi:rubrerythrin